MGYQYQPYRATVRIKLVNKGQVLRTVPILVFVSYSRSYEAASLFDLGQIVFLSGFQSHLQHKAEKVQTTN